MIVREGSVVLEVPKVDIPEHGEVFYNPKMVFDRNISVCVAKLLPEVLGKVPVTLDALSASGVRALRYKKESGIEEVWANDCNPKATKLIKENAERNGIEIKITEKEANLLLRERHFDFVDLDPFGSPIRFVDSLSYSLGRNGFFAATATDTAPLCGTYPRVAERRYGIKSMKTDYYAELGARILITAVMRIFARYEKVFIPFFTYSRLHYFRIFGKIERGVSKVNRMLDNFGYVSHCFSCGWRATELEKTCPICGKRTEFCEVYLGEIQNKEFLEKLVKELEKRMYVVEKRFLEKVREEEPIPFYYDLHYLYKHMKKSSGEKIDKIVEKIRKEGYRASRTHFCPTGVKTDMPLQELMKVI